MEIPKELLSKEFLSQFKSEEDVSKFLTTLHSRVLEQMLEGEMDAHLGYENHSALGINTGNSRNGKYSKKIQTEYGESYIEISRDRQGKFEPVDSTQTSASWSFNRETGHIAVCQRYECFRYRRGNERNLWNNPVYIGYIHHNEQSHPSRCRMAESAIGESLFDRVDGRYSL